MPIKARLLIIEDDWLQALDNEAALLEAKFDVVGLAATGEEAVMLAGQTRPDLVLMDIRLAGASDGIDAAIAIRRQLGIACLFLTADSDRETRPFGACPTAGMARKALYASAIGGCHQARREQVEIVLAPSDDKIPPPPSGRSALAERRIRLADALRTNLGKRKQQARERQKAENKEKIEQPDAADE